MNLTSCSLLKYSFFNIYIYANLQRDSGQAAAIRLRFEKNVSLDCVRDMEWCFVRFSY